ncbi:MAG TPA: ABC transporter substrate-binding protein [Candidatus Methylomirabilis sp.]|nr:ABC transporter substrate-binding protein [Candidatus Methylomirabilis sp.]
MRGLIEKIRERLQRLFFWHESGKQSGEFIPTPEHDHDLVLAVTEPKRVPRWRQIRYAGRVMTRKERRIIAIAVLTLVAALGAGLWGGARAHIISVPASGGSIIEAVLGAPKYPNPLYATTNDPDADLVALVYAGLFRRVDGSTVVPDLVERFEWSPDGKRLTLTLRGDARFHDGTAVTSDDVVFTLNAAKDPAWRSTYAAAFRSMTIEREDDRTVSVTLERPDVTVLDTLTLGILPVHVWQDVPPAAAPLADANVRPIGAGPFRVRSFRRDAKGSILAYTLERNNRYHGLKPFLKQIELRYFADRDQAEEALRGGQVDSLAFVPGPSIGNLTRHERLTTSSIELPQETIAFMNVNDAILKDVKVRQALTLVVERADVVNAQADAASPVSGPFPFAPYVAASSTPEERLDQARALLVAAGWITPENGDIRIKVPPKPKPATTKPTKTTTKSPAPAPVSTTSTPPIATASSTQFALTIEVPDVPDLVAVTDVLKRRWSLLGAKVSVKVADPASLAQRATGERNSQILVWNMLLSPSQDLFPIWWSGEASGRGLNLSNLTDRNVDDAIEAARAATTTAGLLQARDRLATVIQSRWPAIFLTRPAYGYVHNTRLRGMSSRLQLGRPSDRFNDAANWYVKTGWRWK